jgi:hypothetical protein
MIVEPLERTCIKQVYLQHSVFQFTPLKFNVTFLKIGCDVALYQFYVYQPCMAAKYSLVTARKRACVCKRLVAVPSKVICIRSQPEKRP